ncbi:uncharacterized protein VP01_2279g2 [Puccinia sorghi]|uniref:Uncharacterized protein n=1 Tax=Puccinia sorghi TaxID=27349 RepID=A0A0L6V878_9BASI|nr:uncharacterized protein VP01_2279g2 [Puccinia sorghi]
MVDLSQAIMLDHIQAVLRKESKDKDHVEGNHLAEGLQNFASESDWQFTSAGPFIRDATRTGFPPIKWHVYLLRSPSLPEFTKYSHYLITNLASFTIGWITAVADLGKDLVNTGFQLKMESHGNHQGTIHGTSLSSAITYIHSIFGLNNGVFEPLWN